jgi:hypothetical protein
VKSASQAPAASAVKGAEGILALRRPASRASDGGHDLSRIRIGDGCSKKAFKDIIVDGQQARDRLLTHSDLPSQEPFARQITLSAKLS